MKSILVIGSSNTDMVIRSAQLPAPGETVLGGEFLMNPGGKGANQAVAAARLGGKVRFLARVGADLFGEEAVRGFEREGIQTDLIIRDPEAPSGVALILVGEGGENLISVASGANNRLSQQDIAACSHAIEEADILLLQLETPIAAVSLVVQEARKRGKIVILNPAPAATLPAELLAGVSILTPNEHEAATLTGIPVTDLDSAGRASDVLLDMGVSEVLITMGAAGVFYRSTSESWHQPAPAVSAVDTTAAGDTFNGALAASLSRGATIREATAFGVKAASLSVTRHGAQASCPFLHEITP